MNICIPIEKNEGMSTRVFGHFGSAPYFAIYDSDAGTLEIVNNGDLHHAHGQCNPIGALSGRSVNLLVTGGIGARAIERLNSMGIRVCRARAGSTIEDVLGDLAGEGLPEIQVKDACSHHHSCS
jgi:predicted Fe-Mo cluster-binding NifX family protein